MINPCSLKQGMTIETEGDVEEGGIRLIQVCDRGCYFRWIYLGIILDLFVVNRYLHQRFSGFILILLEIY